uniref:Putative ATPase domain containing protein n=1 Tax=viral metagenome TaxID=1070528 RepID=A0A6M3IGS7_9ZZZZ
MCLARGENWFEFGVHKAFRVGIVQQEIPEASLKDRLMKMITQFSDLEFLGRIPHLTRSSLKLDDPVGKHKLREWLDEAKADLVIIDPLYAFHSGRENDSGDMGKVCQELQKIAEIYECGVLLIHHHGKPGIVERVGGDQHRGASVLRDATDGNWTFNRFPPKKYVLEQNPSQYVELAFELRHAMSPEPMLLYLNPETLWFERALSAAEFNDDLVIETLINAKELSTSLLVEALKKLSGKTERTCYRWVQHALQGKKVSRDSNNVWRPL